MWPDVTPVKNAFAKVVKPVKTACRNSYATGSAAFAKVDSAVRTIRLPRRTAGDETDCTLEKTSAEEEVEEPVKTNSCGAFTRIGDAVATPVKSVCRNSCSYGFITFAQIGYAVRVRGVCRIVQWMSDDGTKSIVGVYATDFAQDGSELIPGRGVEMPVKNECRSFYTIDVMTFARIGYVVRVNGLYRIPQLMTGADAKHQIFMFITKLARNVNGLYSAAYESLKDKVGVFAMNDVLGFMVKEFEAFLRTEPFHTQFFSKGILTMESLGFMMREFFEYMMKQFFGDQSFEILVHDVLRDIFGIKFFDQSGFHG